MHPEINSQVEKFREHIQTNRKSLKEDDAVLLLKRIKGDMG
jgi:hypothetical protein